jgi:hypothetical protein
MLLHQISARISKSSFWARKSYSFGDPCRRECNHGLISACGGAWKQAAESKKNSLSAQRAPSRRSLHVNWRERDNAKRPPKMFCLLPKPSICANAYFVHIAAARICIYFDREGSALGRRLIWMRLSHLNSIILFRQGDISASAAALSLTHTRSDKPFH